MADTTRSSIVEDVARQIDPEAWASADRFAGFEHSLGAILEEAQNGRERQASLERASAYLSAFLAGPVGDVLRAAQRFEQLDAGFRFSVGEMKEAKASVFDAARALPSDLTDMLGGKS